MTTSRNAALAAALIVVGVLVDRPSGTGSEVQTALWWGATALIAAALTWRHRWPLPMLVLGTAAVAVHLAQPLLPTIADLAVLVLLYTVASRHGRVVSGASLACLLLLALLWSTYSVLSGTVIPGVPTGEVRVERLRTTGPDGVERVDRQDPSSSWSGLVVLGSALLAAWAIGSGTRNRRAYLDQLHRHTQDLERQRDQQAALAVAAERARISREMHDVVAHGLSLIVIQAQGGSASLDKRPAETRDALREIVTTGRDTLADLRRTLAALGEVDDRWHPPPGLAQLPALLDQVRQAGTPVRLRTSGEAVALPSAVDLTAYRVVQEALTNTRKHASAGAGAEVQLAYGDAGLVVEVSDDGSDPVEGDGGGSGLRGMDERVKLLGGHLTTGSNGAGFVVRATLPL